MAVPPLPLFVVVIDRARARSRTRADECTFPSANQSACTRTDGCTDADAFRGLLFPRLRIAISPALAAGDRNCERKREQQQQN